MISLKGNYCDAISYTFFVIDAVFSHENNFDLSNPFVIRFFLKVPLERICSTAFVRDVLS